MSKVLDIKAPDGNIYTISVNDDVSDNDALKSFADHYKQNMEQGGKPSQPSGAADTFGNQALRTTRDYVQAAGALGRDVAKGGIGAITGIPELLMRGYNYAGGKAGLPQVPESAMPSTAVDNLLNSPEIAPQSSSDRFISNAIQAGTGALSAGSAGKELLSAANPVVQTAGKVLGGGLSPTAQVAPMVLGSAAADVAKESGNPQLALPASLIGSMTPAGIRMMAGGVGSNIGQRVLGETGVMGVGSGTGQTLVKDAAMARLAQLLGRDAYKSDPVEFARGRLDQLAGRGSLANIGQNTLSEADLLASLPGSAKPMFTQEAARVSGTRGPVLQSEVDKALGTADLDLGTWKQATIAKRSAAADPLYAQVNDIPVKVDKELYDLLQRSESVHGLAEKTAKVAGSPIDLSKLTPAEAELKQKTDALMNTVKVATESPADSVPFKALDQVKQSLYDAADSAKQIGNKNLGREYDSLRKQLTSKLDEISPKDANGVSIYKQARQSFEGPSQLMKSADVGTSVTDMKLHELKEAIAGMSEGERETMKIGAALAYKEKLGFQSGQTQQMAFLKNPDTRDRIDLIFGDKADDFKRALLREADIKQIERVGQGSGTMPRSALAEDQGMSLDAAHALATMHSPVAAISALAKGRKYLSMPEDTRNKLAEMLLARGDTAESHLNDLQQYMAEQAMSSAQRKRLAGVLAARNAAQAGQE